MTDTGVFSGGPNGTITLTGVLSSLKIKLINGGHFEINNGEQTVQIPVENSEIFSKYDWDLFNQEKVELKDSGAKFSDLSGQVRIRPDIDKRGWHNLKPGEAIPFGTHISTGAASSVVIILPDGVKFFLEPNTEIVINEPSEKTSHSQILYGSMKVTVEKKIQDESLEIDMDQAVIEISGTTLLLEEMDGKSTLKVIEGTVNYKSKVDNKTILVRTGEMVVATKDGM